MKDRNIAERQRPSRTRKPKVSGKAGIKKIPESERSYRTQLSVLMASPFMFAIEHGDLKTVKALMDSGIVGLSVRDPNGNEPLHAAAEQKDPEVIQFLIKHGAYLETKNDQGQTPLHVACQHGHTEVAKLFMDLGLDVCLNDKNADTPLHTACFHGYTPIVRLLLDHGADVNVERRDGETPLHIVCREGHTDIVRLLLKHGADVEARCKHNTPPLHMACRSRASADIVTLLLEHGADVNALNTFNNSALHYACASGRPATVRLLLEAGVDPCPRNTTGETPFDTWMKSPVREDYTAREEILDLFRQYAPEVVMEAWCNEGVRP